VPATQVIVVPRWGGTAADDWYPWLGGVLAARGIALHVLDLPDPAVPRVEPWVRTVESAILAEPAPAHLVVVGHSVGCRALLAALERLPEATRVAGALLVAAWWTIDETWPEAVPWEALRHDAGRIRAAAGRPVVLLSDDDPFTAGWEENRRLWEAGLDADVRVHPGAAHFNAPREPAVLAAVLELAR